MYFSFTYPGLRIPLFWKDSEHFNSKGSEWQYKNYYNLLFLKIHIFANIMNVMQKYAICFVF